MSIEEFIISHIEYIQKSRLEPYRKAKAVLGLRRVLYDMSYRKRTCANWFYDTHNSYIPIEYLSVFQWSRTQEGYDFWELTSSLLKRHDHR